MKLNPDQRFQVFLCALQMGLDPASVSVMAQQFDIELK